MKRRICRFLNPETRFMPESIFPPGRDKACLVSTMFGDPRNIELLADFPELGYFMGIRSEAAQAGVDTRRAT